MAQFSGAMKLADMNDFIAPAQACVVTLNGAKLDELPSDDALTVRLGRQVCRHVSSQAPAFTRPSPLWMFLRDHAPPVQSTVRVSQALHTSD
jgi:hypothetical protein